MKSLLKSNRVYKKPLPERRRTDLLSLAEVASYLKVAQRTVFRMIQRKEIPAVKVGRLWRIQWGWLQDWLTPGNASKLPFILASPVASVGRELTEALRSLYGSRLKGIHLYGSYARGEAGPDSDLDLLVVLDDFSDVGEELARTAPLASQLALTHGVPVALMFVRERDFLSRQTPFLVNVRKEARPIAA